MLVLTVEVTTQNTFNNLIIHCINVKSAEITKIKTTLNNFGSSSASGNSTLSERTGVYNNKFI